MEDTGFSERLFAPGAVSSVISSAKNDLRGPADLAGHAHGEQAAGIGLSGVAIPAEWGGAGRDMATYAHALERVGHEKHAHLGAAPEGGQPDRLAPGPRREIPHRRLLRGRLRLPFVE